MLTEAHVHDAERQVIGAILLDPDRFHELAAEVSPEDFEAPLHREVWQAVAGMLDRGEAVDAVTVSQQGLPLAEVGELANECWGSANALTYAKTVRDYSQRRRIARACRETVKSLVHTGAIDAAGALAAELESITAQRHGYGRTWVETLLAGAEHIEHAKKLRESGGVLGVPFGIPALDQRTGGICPGRLVVVGARPSVGKTALTLQAVLHGALAGHGAGICSLEMDYSEIACRAMANRYQLNFTRLLHGSKTEAEELTRKAAERSMSQLPIFVDCDTYDIHGIVARITEWKRKHGIAQAVVDHIGLIDGGSGERKMDRLAEYSRAMKLLAKKLHIGIVLVCQLNRSNEREQRRPRLSDLRECGEIEQDADVVLMLHAEEQPVCSDLIVHMGLEKNRTGRRGWLPDSERVLFNGATQTFRQIDMARAVA
jgi:replicative DNA helicase